MAKPVTRTDKGEGIGEKQSGSRFGRVKASASSTGVALDMVDSNAISSAICAVVAAGAAIMLSNVRTGRAVRIVIYDGDNKLTYYANSVDELESLLENLRFIAENAPEAF